MTHELQGLRALVTGAASGIGAAIAARFRSEGAVVAGLDINPVASADLELTADMGSDESVSVAMAKLKGTLGLPDIVVHAAAITAAGGVLDTAPDGHAQIYSVNVLGALRLMQHCVPAMREKRNGSIVLISSINADFATPTQAAYAASKAALNNLMKTAALEFAPDGIRVNSIAPASIDTPRLRQGFDAQTPQATKENMKRHPLARWGTVEEVAELALFLASARSSWITGAVHRIDGGASVTRR